MVLLHPSHDSQPWSHTPPPISHVTYSTPETLTCCPLQSWACLALTASHCLLNLTQGISPPPASVLSFIEASLPEPHCQVWITIPHHRISRTFQKSSHSPALPPLPQPVCQLVLSSTIREPFSYFTTGLVKPTGLCMQDI